MKKVFGFSLFIALLSLVAPAAADAQVVATSNGSGVARFALMAGQHINAGEVTVRVHNGNVAVTYATTGGWALVETQAWVGSSLSGLPTTNAGNPSIGQFPHKAENLNGATTQTFTIPLTDAAINFSCPAADTIYYVAAHATVRRSSDKGAQTETAWSAGSAITAGGSWATFSTFTLTCPTAPGSGSGSETACETAFARDAAANVNFLAHDIKANRWGWSNGPYTAGTSRTIELWAAAGKSNATKGVLAGTVAINYTGSVVTVTYAMNSGWWLNETHAYVGSTMFPMQKQGAKLVPTVSPGAYPQKHALEKATTDTFAFAASGPVYVIAHAAPCHTK